jgi:hypothetical protein
MLQDQILLWYNSSSGRKGILLRCELKSNMKIIWLDVWSVARPILISYWFCAKGEFKNLTVLGSTLQKSVDFNWQIWSISSGIDLSSFLCIISLFYLEGTHFERGYTLLPSCLKVKWGTNIGNWMQWINDMNVHNPTYESRERTHNGAIKCLDRLAVLFSWTLAPRALLAIVTTLLTGKWTG